jgi:hypothetical protein
MKVNAGFFLLERVCAAFAKTQKFFGARERSRAASEIPDISLRRDSRYQFSLIDSACCAVL